MKILWLLMAIVTVSLGIAFYYFSDRESLPSDAAVMTAPSADGAELGFVFAQPPHPVAELKFVGSDGQPMSLGDFRGKFVLFNIWATWCAPCRHEMPALDRLQARLGGPDFIVLPLSIDIDGLEEVRSFYQELELKALGIYVDETGNAGNDLNVVGVPTTLLLDRQGREIARKVGIAEWDSAELVAFFRYYIDDSADTVTQSAGGGDDGVMAETKDER